MKQSKKAMKEKKWSDALTLGVKAVDLSESFIPPHLLLAEIQIKRGYHKSAIKRIRNSEVKKQRNRYQHKTARTAMKKFFEISKKKEAEKELPLLVSMIDKLAKNNIIHDNKAANLKANFAKHASGLKK